MNETTLVCALADAPMTSPGSVFNRKCGTCGRFVMISPSGQKFIAARPHIDVKLICLDCAPPVLPFRPVVAIAQLVDDINRAIPNLRRYRN